MTLLIFDCDGVLVDSEPLANRELAAMLTAAGLPTTTEESVAAYMGRKWSEIARLAETRLGAPLPATFKDDYYERIFAVFARELQPVPGIAAALEALDRLPSCVASSGPHAKIHHTLTITGLKPRFPDDRIFSAWDVPRGKPAPDLFLKAAADLGHEPANAIVIEDSPVGVEAARAAGMSVLGYAGRTPREQLRMADAVFETMAELPALVAATAAEPPTAARR